MFSYLVFFFFLVFLEWRVSGEKRDLFRVFFFWEWEDFCSVFF